MISEFIIDVDIEINKNDSKIDIDDLKNEMELLTCNPSLVAIICDLAEISITGDLIFHLEEKLDVEEDYSGDIETILCLLLDRYGNRIEEGSNFQCINRNSISSITWTMEDGEWEVYQDINRDYGYGAFEDFEGDEEDLPEW